jgi:hypothetical protein
MNKIKYQILFLLVGILISVDSAHSRKPKIKCEEEEVTREVGSKSCGTYCREYVDTIFHIYKDGEEIETYSFGDGNGINSIDDCKDRVRQLKHN